jgi:acyl carrier protein
MTDDVRKILQAHARLATDAGTLAPHDDLYEAGMTSHASVNVMLALEDRFDLEFPDEMLKPSVFASIAAIVAAVERIQATQAAA